MRFTGRSLAMKRRSCAWDDEFLLQVLTGEASEYALALRSNEVLCRSAFPEQITQRRSECPVKCRSSPSSSESDFANNSFDE
jgi:hypothetical protein